jgi:hypothetical protein
MKMRGFLAMLLLVVVIVFILYYVKSGGQSTIETQIDRFERTRGELTKVNLNQLGQGILGWMADQEGAPATLQVVLRTQPTLGAVVDGWGREFRYMRLSADSFRLASAGPDGEFDTEDDISRDF